LTFRTSIHTFALSKRKIMAKRLVKVASELNVGTGTIVEHLNYNGFSIQDKPTAKVHQ